MLKRRVRRRPARPIEGHTTGLKGHIKRFFLSFTPRYFKTYWISRAGLIRLSKLAGAGFIFVFLVFLWYAKDLPTPGKINARVTAQTTKFYDASGNKLLYELYGDQNRNVVAFDKISKHAKNATIAVEDKDFYNHGAFSFTGYLRAAIIDITHRTKAQGGSTITLQYVKNALLDPTDRSFSRKIKELILSIEIELRYSKDTILELYLNEIPYGSRAYGIESACKTFFPQNIDKQDKEQHCAKNLNLEQSAILAAVLNGPSRFSPYGIHKQELIDRQHMVLDRMVDQRYAAKADADAAKWTLDDLKNPDKISQKQNLYANLDARVAHFVLYAQDYLIGKYGEATVTEGGLRVNLTMDYDKQIAAYDAVQANMRGVVAGGGSNAAVVSTDPKSGHILAMIGSHDFNGDATSGALNVAAAKRQPGSSFKPIVYATLFGKNKDTACAKTRECPTYGPGTTLYDVPTSFGGSPEYKPNNFGNKSYGIITARQALAGSLNIPAVKAIAMAGVSDSIQTAQALGIDTLGSADGYGLSLVLGTGGVELTQMTNAYESFANGGLHYEQTPILMVRDQKGAIMEDNSKPKKPKQALDPQVASLMADVLSDNNAKQYVFQGILSLKNNCGNNQATNCVHVGVKTGTTEKFNDAWTVGFTPDLATGVWVGNNDGHAMGGVAAANIAGPIWKAYMNSQINGKANAPFAKATGLKTVTLDKTTGRSVADGTKDTTIDSFPSWYTAMGSTGGRNAQIDKISGKLATQCTPELAKETVFSSAVLPEITKTQNPSQYQLWLTALQKAGYSSDGGDLPTAPDDKHNCDDIKPKANITGATGGGPYEFNVEVTSGTFTADKLQVYFDDQIISTQVINGTGSYPVSYAPKEKGSHTFKAVVTDAGLYKTEDEQTVTITNITSGEFSGITPAEGSQVSAGSITFTWGSAPEAATYNLYVDGVLRGVTNTTSKSIIGLTVGNHTWYARADTGDSTAPISFKVKP